MSHRRSLTRTGRAGLQYRGGAPVSTRRPAHLREEGVRCDCGNRRSPTRRPDPRGGGTESTWPDAPAGR